MEARQLRSKNHLELARIKDNFKAKKQNDRPAFK